jgi:hypothetical protein
MKLPLLLCTLILSLQGWCASAVPSDHRAARAITPTHQTCEEEKLQGEVKMQLQRDKMKTALMEWGLIIYVATITWWAATTKRSLDKILKEVLQSIVQYS